MRARTWMRHATAATATLLAAARGFAGERPTRAQIQSVTDTVFSAPEFDYTPDEPNFLERGLRRIAEFVRYMFLEHPVISGIVLGASLLLLVVLIAHMIWTMRAARQIPEEVETDADIEAALRALDPGPFQAKALAEAQAGRYDEAVRLLYTALLLTLDGRGAIRYARHKALLDYRLEARSDDEGSRVLQQFAATYPPGSFGRRPPDPARFDELVEALRELRS